MIAASFFSRTIVIIVLFESCVNCCVLILKLICVGQENILKVPKEFTG